MNRHFLSGLALLAIVSTGAVSATITPAAAVTDPVCTTGFVTIKKLSWLLECEKKVAISQMGVAVTQANNAVCKTYNYWNFGPKVTTKINRLRGFATINYICGHVEG